MSQLPILSIITVTYNAEAFLERTLKSVQKAAAKLHGHDLLELLIIDGKSKDNTLKIAEKYRPVVTRIISEPDKGLYDAMNKGLKLAAGKYVWFLNAGDEIYDENVLVSLYDRLAPYPDICYSDAMLVLENGSEIGLRSQFTPHTLPEKLRWQDFALGMKVCHQAFIVRKEITPFYDATNLSADIDWEIVCLKNASRVEFLPFLLCRYLMGGTSVQNHRRSLLDRFRVLHKHFGLIPAILNHVLIFWRGFVFLNKNGRYW